MFYYCVMEDEPKNVCIKQVMLEDGSLFYYTVKPFEMKNMLGAVVAVLDEYLFTKNRQPGILYTVQNERWKLV